MPTRRQLAHLLKGKPTSLIAIDPGSTHSAVATFDDDGLFVLSLKLLNYDLINILRNRYLRFNSGDRYFVCGAAKHLAIEGMACYGMSVGAEVFDTCFWSGRFVQAWGDGFTKVYRKDVKLHLCNSVRAKDKNVRQAIIDRYGGKDAAIGCKAKRGPLYGVSSDQWAAIAVGHFFLDTQCVEIEERK